MRSRTARRDEPAAAEHAADDRATDPAAEAEHADAVGVAMGSPARIAGADEVARKFSGRAQAARRTDLDGIAAAAWSVRGEVKVKVVFAFTVEDGLIREIELLADGLDKLDLAGRPIGLRASWGLTTSGQGVARVTATHPQFRRDLGFR